MQIKRAKSFKKQYRACLRRGYNMSLLDAAIIAIVTHREVLGVE
ncbi:type II toxin-antitoxin system YafQ family toxin [Lacticaseibacillus nasuensis]|nr:type II toxin-antitoxin system YafQ family toxin [Lacticaseibacillus nasuensis]